MKTKITVSALKMKAKFIFWDDDMLWEDPFLSNSFMKYFSGNVLGQLGVWIMGYLGCMNPINERTTCKNSTFVFKIFATTFRTWNSQ